MAGTLPSNIVRFGIFEANLETGELRRNGARVKLQDQPFQLLALLLARPGEIVTREEVRSQLWSDDTFVDFDHGLNAAIRRLREALGDSADNPRFVETLARRGYRFIAPVGYAAMQPTTPAGEAPGDLPEKLQPPLLDPVAPLVAPNASRSWMRSSQWKTPAYIALGAAIFA